MKKQIGDYVADVQLLVTASAYLYNNRSLTLLILEDIHELMVVGGLLPICANCKKIRSRENEWQHIEGYIQKHIVDVDFTHRLCPEYLYKFFRKPQQAHKTFLHGNVLSIKV